MKIAITGGAGFIGTALAERLLAAGHDVTLLDVKSSPRYPARTKDIDIRDVDSLKSALAGMDAVYHLAAEHRDDVRPATLYHDVNVTGTRHVIEAAEHNRINTIIFSSSVAVYGLKPLHREKGSSEDDPPAPFNEYGRTKYEAEKLLREWADRDRSHFLGIVRLVATFGPGNRGNIYNLIHQIARNRFVMIGRGSNKKSIACLENVAAFLCHLLPPQEASGFKLYNYADKPDLTMRDLVLLIRRELGKKGLGPRLPYILGILGGTAFDLAARLTGKTFPISLIRVQKFCAHTTIEAERLQETGFTPPCRLEEGLCEMIKSGEFGL